MSNHDYITGRTTVIEELRREAHRLYRAGSPSLDDAVRTLQKYRADPSYGFGGHRAICNPALKDSNYYYCPICGDTNA